MKKIALITFSFCLLYGCGNNDKSNKAALPVDKQNKQTSMDKELHAWMQGKLWKTEDGMAPFTLLKLNKNGLCEFKQGPSDQWSIQDGKFVLNRLTEWPIKKVDDSTFSLYVKPTDKTYLYRSKESL
jgi:hypothetical protein